MKRKIKTEQWVKYTTDLKTTKNWLENCMTLEADMSTMLQKNHNNITLSTSDM